MKQRHLFSSISFRLLVFNLLIVFFPVAAFLLLNTYEEQLLKLLEHALVQQGRIVAAAMGGQESVEAGGVLDGEEAQNFLRRLRQAHEARIRIVDREGRVLADSSVLFPKGMRRTGGRTPLRPLPGMRRRKLPARKVKAGLTNRRKIRPGKTSSTGQPPSPSGLHEGIFFLLPNLSNRGIFTAVRRS